MTFTGRVRIAAAGTAAMLAVGAASAYAGQTSTVTVGATVINGTRTLTVKSLTGTQLGAFTLGTGHAAAFLVNVSDINYAHVGYQVTATMSNLYPYSGGYQFTAPPIPSSAVSLAFAGNAFDVTNLSTLVTPLIHLASTSLPFSVATPLDTTIAGTTKTVATIGTQTQKSLSSLLDQLPVRVATGAGGAFTDPAAVTGQSGTFNPTAVDVMDGTKQSMQGLLDDLVSALNAGHTTAQDFVDAGLLDQNAVIAAGLGALGLTSDQLTSGLTAQLLAVPASVTDLQALVDPVANTADKILGQTGSYNTVPTLSLTLPNQQPAGNYQGELTFTLMDK